MDSTPFMHGSLEMMYKCSFCGSVFTLSAALLVSNKFAMYHKLEGEEVCGPVEIIRPCSCEGHRSGWVRHIVPCCDFPHVSDEADVAWPI